jgi:hypothetical protein
MSSTRSQFKIPGVPEPWHSWAAFLAALVTIVVGLIGVFTLCGFPPNTDGQQARSKVAYEPTPTPTQPRVTSTRVQSTSTATSVPATPTPAFPPTSTPRPNTSPGTVLSPDDKCYEDGVEVSLARYYFTPGSVESWIFCYAERIDLKLFFRIRNVTSDPIVFDYGGENFRITTNAGGRIQWYRGEECSSVGPMVLQPGQETVQGEGSSQGEVVGDIRVFAQGDYTLPGVDYIDVEVVGLSRVERATWRIPIRH